MNMNPDRAGSPSRLRDDIQNFENESPFAGPGAAASAPTEAQEILLAKARQEAQERVADLHAEEGTVHSEGAYFSSIPADERPYAAARTADAPRHLVDDLREQAAQLRARANRFMAKEPGLALAVTAAGSAMLTAAILLLTRGRRHDDDFRR